MRIDYLDLRRLHSDLRSSLLEQFTSALDSADFILGSSVTEFETRFAALAKSNYCVGVSSGTSALQLALEALGVGQGDEVIVPANSFTATAAAVRRAGAEVLFCDVDPTTRLATLDSISPLVSEKTRAVIPVHLHGNVVNVQSIREGLSPNIFVVEDASQGHGGSFFGDPIGTHSEFSTYSFYPGKNLGGLGDAGSVCTNSRDLAESVRQQRNWGEPKSSQNWLGYNERMDSLQARFLNVKLDYFKQWEMQRMRIARFYLERLSHLEGVQTPDASNPGRVWHVFSIEFTKGDRDQIKRDLMEVGIETKIHYPQVIPDQQPYNRIKRTGIEVARSQAKSQLSLPLDPHLGDTELEYIVESLSAILAKA